MDEKEQSDNCLIFARWINNLIDDVGVAYGIFQLRNGEIIVAGEKHRQRNS